MHNEILPSSQAQTMVCWKWFLVIIWIFSWWEKSSNLPFSEGKSFELSDLKSIILTAKSYLPLRGKWMYSVRKLPLNLFVFLPKCEKTFSPLKGVFCCFCRATFHPLRTSHPKHHTPECCPFKLRKLKVCKDISEWGNFSLLCFKAYTHDATDTEQSAFPLQNLF